MKAGNKGLTVKLNLWALDRYKDDFSAAMARVWLRGTIVHADTGRELKFNDPGELLSILGKWNVAKLKEHKGRGRRDRR
jgi:hypothetical protein